MAVRRKKIVKIKPSLYALLFLGISFLIYLGSALVLRQYNVTLSKRLQSVNAEINSYETQNAAVSLEIQQLSAYDRVMAIATENGMALFEDNIITITDAE